MKRSTAAPPGRGGKQQQNSRAEGVKGWTWEWIRSIAMALALFLVIRTFIVEAFRIPTGSMEQTLLVGDFLLVNKLIYGAHIPGTHLRLLPFRAPARGDVVVFRPPHEPDKNYVKRLVGLSGDTLMMRQKVLYRNGRALDEPYVQYVDRQNDISVPSMHWQRRFLAAAQESGAYRPSRDNWGPIVVPEHVAFMLGDNRDDSEDSRFWGFVDLSEIKGKPLFIYYSFEPHSARPFPWITHIRWSRLGSLIH